jgi:hypothetical protein
MSASAASTIAVRCGPSPGRRPAPPGWSRVLLESLARDEGRTALSALLLHYGNIALGLAWLGTALALFENVAASPGVAIVGTVTLFGLLGPLVVLGGLARAGVTSWWLLAPAVAAFAASAALTFEPLLYAGLALVGAVPMVVVGLRMIQRRTAEDSVASF